MAQYTGEPKGTVNKTINEMTTSTPGHANSFNPYWRQIVDNDAELEKRVNDHKNAAVLDHPDGSVTTEKIADGAVTAAKVAADVAKKADLDAHANTTIGAHGATSAATPNTIVQRDPNGRFKAAAPSAADDVARKQDVDAVNNAAMKKVADSDLNMNNNSITNINTIHFRGPQTLTIDSNKSITVNRTMHRVNTSGGPDELHTINGGNENDLLLLRIGTGDNPVTIKHGMGNIATPDGVDIPLTNVRQWVLLIKTSVDWHVIASGTGLNRAGGVMTGDINSSAADFQIGKTNNTGRTIIKGGSSGSVATGANIHVEGIDYGGAGNGGNVRINLPSGKNLLVNGNAAFTGEVNFNAPIYARGDFPIFMIGIGSDTANKRNYRWDISGQRLFLQALDDSLSFVRHLFEIYHDGTIFRFNGNNVWHAGNLPHETGNWTPDLRFGGSNAGITYTSQMGYYIRVGNLVYWTFGISLSSRGVAAGNAEVRGLPFNVVPGPGFFHNVSVAQNITVPSGQWLASSVGNRAVYLYTSDGSYLTSSAFSNGSKIYASGVYITY